jgi:hypothetical protein
MTPLPRNFRDLAPNVLIARCVQCKRLAFANELCLTQQAVAVCSNMSEPQKGWTTMISNGPSLAEQMRNDPILGKAFTQCKQS